MEEIWKDIKGYEDIYQVSNLGNVKRINYFDKQNKDKYKNQEKRLVFINLNGYYRVVLSKCGINKNYFVHRLVAQAFIPNPENKPFINHINGTKTDNKVENLEWCTAKENTQHARNTGLFTEEMITRKKGKNNWASKKVNQYDLNGKFIRQWECVRDVLRELKIDNTSIYKCCKGIRKTAGGFIWKYEKQKNNMVRI